MTWEFLNSDCREAPRKDKEFGLCDDEDGRKAYSDTSNPDKWIAIVENEGEKEVSFIAVDKCIFQDGDKEGRGRCDGILISAEHIYFVELKNKREEWIEDAKKQLISTIKLFKELHDISTFKHRKAFVCNKKHQHFRTITKEENQRFFKKYGVRLDIQAKIIII